MDNLVGTSVGRRAFMGIAAAAIAVDARAASGAKSAKTLNGDLQNLLDKEAIRALAIAYCYHVRSREIDKIVALFSRKPDYQLPAELGKGVGGLRQGADAIRASLETGLPQYEPWPFVHNHLIELTSSTTAKGWLHSEIRLGKRNLQTEMLVAYEDEYIKEDGHWKFQSRNVNVTNLA